MRILITGGTGLVGQRLLQVLATSGYNDLRILSRNRERAQRLCAPPIQIFEWEPSAETLDPAALEGVGRGDSPGGRKRGGPAAGPLPKSNGFCNLGSEAPNS